MLDGTGAGAEASGFVLQASNSTITGFRIQNFVNGTTSITGTGIVIDGTTGGGDNNTISQNYLTNNSESVTGAVGAISITGAADNNLITDNQLINNNSDGIRFADALSTGAQITNNVIAGSGDDGVKLVGANITFTGNTVSNSQRLSATAAGVELDTVSGTSVISNNTITNDGTRGIEGGVWLANNSTGVTVGNNTITGWSGSGIAIGGNSTGIHLTQNSITNNGLLGIDLGANGVTANDAGDGDTGANSLQNFPVLTSAQVLSSSQVTLAGSLNSTASSQFRIEFFSNTAQDGTGHGEGQTYLGFVDVTTDGSGNANFNTTLTATVSAGSFVSATATRSNATFTTFTDTSEFAQNAVAANTAPALDASRSPVLTSINEDAGAPVGAVGTLVRNLVDFAVPAGQVDNVADADLGALLGIAITATDTTNGTWFYSTNNGTSWNPLGAVANNNALLLAADANTRLYFQPNADYNGTLANAITFLAWDQTSGGNGTLADTSTNGGTTAFSTATDTASLTVTPVNDAPLNTVPGAQNTNEDATLVFSAGNGNLISISDVDVGGAALQVTLTGTNGLITLNGTAGLTFTVGDGTADATMTFTGTVANINTALAGMSFGPTPNFTGAASLQLVTNDQGNTGSGGPLSDTDTVNITVNAVNDAPIVVNQGLLFDGVDDVVVVNSSASLQVTTTVTMEAWVQRQGTPTGTQILMNKEGEYEFGITSTGVIQWAFANTTPGWNWVSTGYTLPANQWTHIAISYDSGVVNTYFNGELVHSYNGSGSIGDQYPALNELTFGGRQNASTQRFEGLIDEVRVWNVARTGAQISTNYDQTLAGSESGLVGYWRFAEATGTTALDLTANANNGALGGGVPSNEPTRQFTYSMLEDGSLSVSAASGVLANASDAEGSPLTAVLVTGPANAASFTLNADGSFSYTPVADYYGSDSFVFRASDGSLFSQSATVTLTITPVNDAPVNTVPGAQVVNEDTALALGGISVNDVDGNLSTVQLGVAQGTVTVTLSGGATISSGANGTATLTLSGSQVDINATLASLSYQGTLNYNGPDTLTVTSTDGNAVTDVDTVAITVNPVNDAPVNTVPGAQVVNEDTALALGGISVNDVDGNLSTVQLGVAQGTVTVTLSGGATISSGANGTATLTLSGSQVDINATLASLSYQGTLNYNGPDTLTVTSTDGNAVTDVDTVAITVSPVDDLPVASADIYAATEDTVLSVPALTGVLANDTGLGDGGLTLTVVGPVIGGAVVLNNDGSFSFTPTANFNGAASFTYQVQDGDGDVSSALVTINVSPVNDAPVVDLNAGGAGNNVTTAFTEQTPVLVAPVGTLSDVDSANMNRLQVTLTARPDGNAVESLALNAAATAAASGAGLTVTYTSASGLLQITGAATTAVYQSILQGILYNNTSDTPTTSNRSITVVARDSTNVSSTSRTATITVTAVNDAPTATNLSAAETYTEDTALNLINIVVSDVDSANVTATLTLSNVAAGSLSTGTSGAVTSTFVGGVWTASGARANVNTLLAGVTFTPALNFNSNFTIATSVNDGVAPAVTGVKAMTGLAVNDAPVVDLNAGGAGNNVTTAFTEQTPVLIVPVGTLSDVDSATLTSLTVTLTARPDGNAVESLALNAAATTAASGAGLTVSYTPATGVLSITGAATTAVYQSILQGIQYNDTSDTPTTSNRSITVVANDGATPSVTRTVTLTVAAVNDAPVVDLNAGGAGNNVTTAFTEQTPVLVAPVGTLSDVDSANMNRLQVTLTARPDGNAVESLALNAAATAAASGAGLTVTYTSASGLLQITGAATTAVYQSILQGILYNNTSDTPTTSNRSITVVARDSTNVSSTSRTATITVTAVNDAPTATNLSAAETYTEDTALNLINIVVSDVDSANVTATLTLSNVAAGSLSTGTSGAVTSTFVGGVWTASGARANVNTLLAGVTFTPALNFNSNFTIATSVNDGVAPAVTGVKAMTGLAVNDAPVVDLNAGGAGNNVTTAFTEQTPVLIVPVGTLSDVDSATLTSLTVTLTARPDGNAVESLALNAAATTAASGAGLTVSYTPATGVLSITGAATTAVYQSILQGIQYNDTSDTPTTSNRSITVVANDGATPSVTRTVTLTVAAVNDAPVNTVPGAQVVNEDTALALGGISVNDVDGNLSTVQLGVAQGTVTVTLSGGATISSGANGTATLTLSGSQVDINATLASLSYQGTLNYNGPDTLTVTSTDGNAVTDVDTVAITVNPVNDAPVNTVPGAQVVNEDTALALGGISVNDVDGNLSTVQLGVAQGTVTVTLSGGATISSGANGTATLTLSGSQVDINATLASLSYQGTLNYNGPDTLTVTSTDGNAVTDVDTVAITVNPVNDAPVNTVPGAQVVNEDTALALGGISVNDVDGNLSTVQLGVANGTVTVTLSGGATISSGANGTATLTLSGSQVDINATLASLSYQGTLNYNGPDTLTVTSTDGNAVTDVDTVAITVNPVNDAPVNTVPGAQVVNEDTALALGGISVNDVDGNLSTVQLGVAQGTVTVTLSGGATISSGANGTATLTLSGSQVDINATLASLSYQGTLNYNGPDTLTVTSTDGNAVTDVDTVAITVNPVNDAPSLAMNAGSTVIQGLTDFITSGELQVTDADNTPAQLTYTVTTVPLNGQLELTTAPGVAIMSFTQADINAGRLVFVHNGAVSTSDSFTFTVSDGAGGTIGTTTFNFTVTPFAPPPPPPPPPPGPGPPVPVPVPVPGPTGPPPGGVVSPVLQPPPVLVTVVGATDEPARKMALLARTFARVEQPEIVPQEPSALPLEPLSMPVKTMLAMGQKLAEHLTRLADDLERAMQEREHQAHLVGRVASFSGIALSVGFVAWILRGGSLLASFLVSMPAWRHFDPMPVLGSGGKDRRKRAREAREEHAQETKEFRGLDRVLKSSGKPAKQKKTGHVRRPKS